MKKIGLYCASASLVLALAAPGVSASEESAKDLVSEKRKERDYLNYVNREIRDLKDSIDYDLEKELKLLRHDEEESESENESDLEKNKEIGVEMRKKVLENYLKTKKEIEKKLEDLGEKIENKMKKRKRISPEEEQNIENKEQYLKKQKKSEENVLNKKVTTEVKN